MPPALSDEEVEEVEEEVEESSGDEQTPAKATKANDAVEEEDDEEDEYVVEQIVGHKNSKKGVLYHVKWQGYDDPKDMTWEHESNLEGVEALDEYLSSISGKVAPKKRKGRKSGVDTESSTPGAAKRMKKEKEWTPPPGSWEDEVDHVDTVEQRINPKTGRMDKYGYLVWKHQGKTQHPLSLIFRKCPQKMLKYFEEHLVFNTAEGDDDVNGNFNMTDVDDDDL